MERYNSFADFIDHVSKIKEENKELRIRVAELETVLLEIRAFMLNIKELEMEDYNFLMSEILRVMKE